MKPTPTRAIATTLLVGAVFSMTNAGGHGRAVAAPAPSPAATPDVDAIERAYRAITPRTHAIRSIYRIPPPVPLPKPLGTPMFMKQGSALTVVGSSLSKIRTFPDLVDAPKIVMAGMIDYPGGPMIPELIGARPLVGIEPAYVIGRHLGGVIKGTVVTPTLTIRSVACPIEQPVPIDSVSADGEDAQIDLSNFRIPSEGVDKSDSTITSGWGSHVTLTWTTPLGVSHYEVVFENSVEWGDNFDGGVDIDGRAKASPNISPYFSAQEPNTMRVGSGSGAPKTYDDKLSLPTLLNGSVVNAQTFVDVVANAVPVDASPTDVHGVTFTQTLAKKSDFGAYAFSSLGFITPAGYRALPNEPKKGGPCEQ